MFSFHTNSLNITDWHCIQRFFNCPDVCSTFQINPDYGSENDTERMLCEWFTCNSDTACGKHLHCTPEVFNSVCRGRMDLGFIAKNTHRHKYSDETCNPAVGEHVPWHVLRLLNAAFTISPLESTVPLF